MVSFEATFRKNCLLFITTSGRISGVVVAVGIFTLVSTFEVVISIFGVIIKGWQCCCCYFKKCFIGYVVGNVLGILFVLLVLLVVAFTSYVKDAVYSKVVLFKNGSTRPLFHLFSSFQTHHKFYNKYVCEKMLIQYTALGFELTTFVT